MVLIRPIKPGDTDKVVSWRNSAEVLKNFIDQTLITPESHMNWYNSKIVPGYVFQFIIFSKELNLDVGSVFLRDIDTQHKKAEFGIFIGESAARGKGYGTEAANLIVNYGFNELKLNKIMLRVLEKNANAIKSYEKAGFKKEGVFREDVIINNSPENIVFMSILKSEWIDQNK